MTIFKIKDLLVYHSNVDNLEANKLREFVEGDDNDDSISSADGDNFPMLLTSSNDQVTTETGKKLVSFITSSSELMCNFFYFF